MTESITGWARRLVSPHHPAVRGTGGRTAVELILRLAGVAALAWIGYLHLHLWLEGYRQIPADGPLFLLDAVAGFVLAAALLAWPRPLAGLLAAGYTAATLGALVISLRVGLLGFHESMSASFVRPALAVESVTVLVLLSWTALTAARLQPPARRQQPAPPDRVSQPVR
jgi:hypothetical protein